MANYELDENGIPHRLPDPPGPPVLEITGKILSEMQMRLDVTHQVQILLGHFPEHFGILADVIPTQINRIKERALDHFLKLPSSCSDPYLRERAFTHAISDRVRALGGGPFTLSFPTIDPYVLGPGHVDLGDDAKPASSTQPKP